MSLVGVLAVNALWAVGYVVLGIRWFQADRARARAVHDLDVARAATDVQPSKLDLLADGLDGGCGCGYAVQAELRRWANLLRTYGRVNLRTEIAEQERPARRAGRGETP